MGTDVEGWTWSRNSASSGTALESQSASGIIDTQDSAWANFTTTGLPEGKTPATITEEEAEEYWEDMTAKDKVEYYEAWEKANPKGDIEEDLEFYEELNVDVDDLLAFKSYNGEKVVNIQNPRTHDYTEGETVTEDEYGKTDTKVLMLRNNHSSANGDFIGTALKYTSTTTVTVDAGTTAKFSVWVKTANLRDLNNDRVVDKGAYIQITHALGSKSQAPLVIKNINTAGVTENNGWVQYNFALKASPFASSSFSIVLGLGMGGGTNRLEYVNGVAYFDDITFETLEDYTPATGTKVVGTEDQKIYSQDEAEAVNRTFTIDFTTNLENWMMDKTDANPDGTYILDNKYLTTDTTQNRWQFGATTEERSGKPYSSVAGNNPYVPTLGNGFNGEDDFVGVFSNVATALNDPDNDFARAHYNAIFAGHDYLTNEKALVLYSARGAAYTAKSPTFNLKQDEKMLFSFFVKTSDMEGISGAGVKLVDNESNPTLSALDTTTAVKIEAGTNKDVHDGWVQCFYFVHNDSGMAINGLYFEFTFGPTTIIDTPKDSYQSGFAVFTKFEHKIMSDSEFDSAVSGSYAQRVVLEGKYSQPTGDSGFGTPVLSEVMDIEKGYALPTEYTGVYSDSVLVGGNSTITNSYTEKYENSEETFAKAGLLNRENSKNNAAYSTILTRLGGSDWNSVFGDPGRGATATQPLVIENNKENKAYGFVGTASSVAANNFTAVALRVKVSGANTKASVYLIDTSTENFDVMTVSRNVTYWYDDDGNVLSKDPSADDFSVKNHTAFKKQLNGLYKANPTWEKYSTLSEEYQNAYFANLQAYEVDKNNNLLLDGATTYDYNDDWKHDGNDGVAFYSYNKDEKWAYAYSNNTTKVFDFSKVNVDAENPTLSPRYSSAVSNAFAVTEIGDTKGNWAEVIFYLRAGENAKNYRLEVWNGTRDGVASTGNGFVAFDSWSGASESDVDTWLANETKDMEENANFFQSVFSFYDHAQYLRYDENIDYNTVGDNYKTYSSSANTEATAYFYTESTTKVVSNDTEFKTYYTYANYSMLDKVQSADPVEEEDDTTDDTEDEDNSANVWLLASSIIVAAVLVLAVASLIVRKVAENVRRKRGVIVKNTTRLKKEKKTK